MVHERMAAFPLPRCLCVNGQLADAGAKGCSRRNLPTTGTRTNDVDLNDMVLTSFRGLSNAPDARGESYPTFGCCESVSAIGTCLHAVRVDNFSTIPHR